MEAGSGTTNLNLSDFYRLLILPLVIGEVTENPRNLFPVCPMFIPGIFGGGEFPLPKEYFPKDWGCSLEMLTIH